jgi:hypothetical protein
MTACVSFDTTVATSGNNTGIVVPDHVIDQLGAGRRPAVLVDLNGYQYHSTVGVMDGTHMISISAAIRKETGLTGGDDIHVVLSVADTPRDVVVPDDFAAALSAQPTAQAFFATLSNSMQRYHIDNINSAKSAQTRQRRIEKAVSLFGVGKQR